MSKVLSRVSILVVALTGLVVVDLRARAEEAKAEKILLKSNYSGKRMIDGARRVILSATLDDKDGWGTLSFDPNVYDGDTATQIAIEQISVRLELVQDDEHAAKGRRLYELKRVEEGCRIDVGPARWFLIKPLKAGQPAWLVFADKDGKFQDVLTLE
jgi:hypothetical protein